jgi:hypothetical protein
VLTEKGGLRNIAEKESCYKQISFQVLRFALFSFNPLFKVVHDKKYGWGQFKVLSSLHWGLHNANSFLLSESEFKINPKNSEKKYA